MTEDLYVAQIVEDGTGKIVRQGPPLRERAADKMAAGMGINLNWDKFSTRVVAATKAVKEKK